MVVTLLVLVRFEFSNHSLGRRLPGKMCQYQTLRQLIIAHISAFGLFRPIVQDDAEGYVMMCRYCTIYYNTVYSTILFTDCIVSVWSLRKPLEWHIPNGYLNITIEKILKIFSTHSIISPKEMYAL